MSELTTDIEALTSSLLSTTTIAVTATTTTSATNPTTTTARARTSYAVSTITQTHYVTSTITASNYEPTARETIQFDSETNNPEYEWGHRIHKFLPVILAFAIIGILTVIGSLIYLAYRFYQARRLSPQRRSRSRPQDAEENMNFEDENKKSSSPVSATLSHIIPWLSIPSPLHPTERRGTNDEYTNHQPRQREPIRYEKADLNRLMMEDTSNSSTRRPSLAPSWLIKILPKGDNSKNIPKFEPPRHMSLPILGVGGRPTIDNLNVPISSTFKPIAKSSLVLVPRSEIWLDPDRRRGVDELDLWERKKSATTVVVPEEEEQSQPPQPTPLMWRFPSSDNVYPDSPESFERRFSANSHNNRRRSIHIDSRHSSTTTVQEIVPPPPKKSFISRSKSESRRYDQQDSDEDEDNNQEDATIASSSISYPNALNYYQEEEQDKDDHHFTNFAITVKLPKSKQQQEQHLEQEEAAGSSSTSNDVRMARQALETSRLKNSSSQWLHSSGSKSF